MSSNDLAGRVRAERKRRGLTQPQAAELAGVSAGTWQNFELGKSTPQVDNLRAIISVFDIDPDGDSIAEATQSEWPDDIKVFLLMMGAYLETKSYEDRQSMIHNVTRQIFKSQSRTD